MKKHLQNKKIQKAFAAATILVAAISLDAAVYVEKGGNSNGSKTFQLGPSPIRLAGVNPFSTGTMATFVVRKNPRDFANVKFKDAAGKDLSLKDWRGKVVLLNLWATWCAPCRYEMPALDRLQGAMGGDNFEVVAVSIDRKGAGVAQKFLDEIKTRDLKLYIDKSAKITRDGEVFGMPTTILINREGKELGRLIGPAEWDSNQAKALITAAIRGKLIEADVH
jgi:thiol-disulfide isomerase/thioredoxin